MAIKEAIFLKKGLTKNRIIQSLNIRFNKKGLITKPLLKGNTDIPILTKNRGESTKNQN